MKTITIRELHERTGEYIRKAAETGEIYVTDRGKTIARIVPEHDRPQTPYFARRKLTPAFRTPRVYIKLVTKSFPCIRFPLPVPSEKYAESGRTPTQLLSNQPGRDSSSSSSAA